MTTNSFIPHELVGALLPQNLTKARKLGEVELPVKVRLVGANNQWEENLY